jgi:dienelactone hydrolase
MKRIAALALLALSLAAHAQFTDRLPYFLQDLRPLSFPDRPVEGPPDRPEPEMGIYKPAGQGPFAAVVLSPTCGGVQGHLGEWANVLVKAGYVVMVLDHFTQRGVRNNCKPPLAVNTTDSVVDAYRALEHLTAQPYVARDRIALAGFSWGAMVGLLLARKDMAERLPREQKALRYRALIAAYPHCYIPQVQTPRGVTDVEFLGSAIDRPLLVLMGGKDEETPAKFCLPRLDALKAKGVKVKWHVFPDATHGWDMRNLHGYNAPTFFGITHTYQYSAEVTAASQQRVLEYLGEELK